MKNISLNTTSKYILSTTLTVALTVGWVYAWAGLTASNGDKLDYVKWNQLVNTVQSGTPTGAIMAFNLPTCPTGWSMYAAAAGRTVIGAGNGAGSATAVGDVWWDKSAPAVSVSSNISASTAAATTATPTLANGNTAYLANATAGTNLKGLYTTTAPAAWSIATLPVNSTVTWGGTAPDNMQPYVALLYCVKN